MHLKETLVDKVGIDLFKSGTHCLHEGIVIRKLFSCTEKENQFITMKSYLCFKINKNN